MEHVSIIVVNMNFMPGVVLMLVKDEEASAGQRDLLAVDSLGAPRSPLSSKGNLFHSNSVLVMRTNVFLLVSLAVQARTAHGVKGIKEGGGRRGALVVIPGAVVEESEESAQVAYSHHAREYQKVCVEYIEAIQDPDLLRTKSRILRSPKLSTLCYILSQIPEESYAESANQIRAYILHPSNLDQLPLADLLHIPDHVHKSSDEFQQELLNSKVYTVMQDPARMRLQTTGPAAVFGDYTE